MELNTIHWLAFFVLVIVMLALDLGILSRKAHVIGMKEAIVWSVIWTVVAVIFNIWVYFSLGPSAGLDFLTAYMLERSLSLDNLFVFLMIFTYFGVDGRYQHRVLFWGIIGALVMRAIFIGAGIAIIQMFQWVLYVMGAFLVFTGVKMAFQKDESIHPEKNPVIRLCSRYLPMTKQFVKGKFFVRQGGRLLATPMFMILLFLATSDLMFAVDSVPAVLAITIDPFVVLTSNVMAILGMRALYFTLAALFNVFHYLKVGISLVLVLVGVKMLIVDFIHLPVWMTLTAVVVVVTISIIASILWPSEERAAQAEGDAAVAAGSFDFVERAKD